MFKFFKSLFWSRMANRVRSENRDLAIMLQRRHENYVKEGRRIIVKACYIGDVMIWSVEDGVIE